jgi:hypothetical protein
MKSRVRLRVYESLLTAGMIVSGLNMVLAAPLIGLMVGSRFTGEESISVEAVFVTAIVALVVGIGFAWAVGALGEIQDRLAGRPARVVQRHTPWLRSLSGERVHYKDDDMSPMSRMDYVLVTLVVATAVAFEIWFFFYSGSPFDQRSGRH